MKVGMQVVLFEYYIFWFTSASQSDHYIRYVCVSVYPEHNSVDFDPILMKLGYVFDINV